MRGDLVPQRCRQPLVQQADDLLLLVPGAKVDEEDVPDLLKGRRSLGQVTDVHVPHPSGVLWAHAVLQESHLEDQELGLQRVAGDVRPGATSSAAGEAAPSPP